MGNSEPLQLLGQQTVAVTAEELGQGGIELLRIVVDLPMAASGILGDMRREGGDHALGGVGPSRLLAVAAPGRGGGGGFAAGCGC